MYNHRRIDCEVELDTCLNGLGSVWKNLVYHVPLQRHYLNLSIVHLEMLNILVTVRAYSSHWATKKILIKCDNAAVVDVLTNSRKKIHSWLPVREIYGK